jgi:hypothetical protein
MREAYFGTWADTERAKYMGNEVAATAMPPIMGAMRDLHKEIREFSPHDNVTTG